MAKSTEGENQSQTKSVKLSRDMRGIPVTAYRCPTDGRKWKAMCAERKQIADWLATYGDHDGSRIFPKIDTLLAAFDTWSRATIFRRLKELRGLGILLSEGLKGERGARVRKLVPSALREPRTIVSEVSDSTAGVSDSRYEPTTEVSNRTTGVSNSPAEVSPCIETQTVTRPSHAVRVASAVSDGPCVADGFAFDFDFEKDNANCYTVTGQSSNFETFWNLYPRKAHQHAARLAWDKLSPNRSLAEKIIFDVFRRTNSRLHIDSWKDRDPNFLPFPENYLRTCLWQDGDAPLPDDFGLPKNKYHSTADTLGHNALTLRNAENCGSLPKGTFLRVLRTLERRGTDFDNDPKLSEALAEYWRRLLAVN